jgi:hypothetical protein
MKQLAVVAAVGALRWSMAAGIGLAQYNGWQPTGVIGRPGSAGAAGSPGPAGPAGTLRPRGPSGVAGQPGPPGRRPS